MTNVRGSRLRTQRKTVITGQEFKSMLDKANLLQDEFLRLRALALLCLLRLTGKRRTEMAILEVDSFKVDATFLNVTFTLLKKRKDVVLSKLATKSIPLSDSLTKPILAYLEYLKRQKPVPKYFLPSTRRLWGSGSVHILANEHLEGRQVFNIVRGLSESVWPHLFRETVASDIIQQDSSIIAAFKVQQRLDLADMRTGFNYLRRFASDIIQRGTGENQVVST
jgi:site-specific recombinase XerD